MLGPDLQPQGQHVKNTLEERIWISFVFSLVQVWFGDYPWLLNTEAFTWVKIEFCFISRANVPEEWSPTGPFYKSQNCVPQARMNLCSPRRLVGERGHGSFWWRFWLSYVGLQAYWNLASCQASFNTYVERLGSGISHFAHSYRDATGQYSA